jgi:hypothetical protein
MSETSIAVLTILALRRFRLIGLAATLAAARAMPSATFLRAADPPPSRQQATALTDALAGLKKSAEAMRGYNVYLTVTLNFPFKSVIVDVKDPEHPTRVKKMEEQPWPKDEEPLKMVSVFRQVFSRGGKQRVEEEESDSKAGPSARRKTLIVDDGKTVRILSSGQQGSIRKGGQFHLEGAKSYQTYLGDQVIVGMSLENLIRERPGTRLVEDPGKNSELVGILLPSGEGQSVRDFEFRVWLDRRHGFLPKKVETYQKLGTEILLSHEMDVIRFAEPKPGVWAPTEMTYTAFKSGAGPYHGEAVNIFHAVVNVERSQWHVDLDDDLFLLPFPPNVQVVDTINSVLFTTGPGDDGKDLEQLETHATKKVPVSNAATLRRKKLDLATVRRQDRDAAAMLLKYEAELQANSEGAIISVIVQVDPRFIGLGGANLDDEGLAFVGKLRDVEELRLSRTQVTDKGLAHLTELTHLKVLDLDNTKVSGAGLKYLASLTDLRQLRLDNNIVRDGKPIPAVLVTDEGLAELKTLKKLELLSLRGSLKGTLITDEGVAKLRQALPNCQIVY